MKRLQLGLLGALIAVLTAARAQITLAVSVFPELDRSVKASLPLWTAQHPDIAINLLVLNHADHHTAMTTALASGSNLPDVMALDVDFVGRFADSGGLEDLSLMPYNAMQYKQQFAGYSFTQAMRPPHGLEAMPLDLGPGTLFYRKDLMDRANVKEEELTKSWDSYIQAGRKLKAATGVYLIANALEIEWNAIRSGLNDRDGIYFDRSGATLVTTPRFQKAFALAKTARLAGIDANVPEWSSEWSEAFKRNQIGSQMMGSWLAGHLETWLAPESAGLWRAGLLPGGLYSSYGGSFFAIPKNAKHRLAAWEFIKFMTLNKTVQINSFRSIDAFPSLISAQDDSFSDQPIAYLGGEKARLLWRDIARRAPAITVSRFDKLAEEVVNVELDNVLLLDKDINTALADAKDIIERRVRR